MNGFPMDENLHGLLAELVQGGEPTSLGRARWFNDLLRPDLQLARETTGMGAVEAQLLRAHRDELAHVLLLAGRARFEAADHPVIAPRDVRGIRRPLDIESVQARASALRQGSRAESTSGGAATLLDTVIRGPLGGAAQPSEYAIAALRLVPSHATKIWLGTFCQFEDQPDRCVELQRSVLAEKPSHFLAAYAWNNIQATYSLMQRYQDSLEASREAALADPSVLRGALGWVTSAIQAGVPAEVEAATIELSMASNPDDEMSERDIYLKQTRARGLWRPTTEAQRLISRWRSAWHPAEPILEAFR